jgi:predicted DNA-binding transcriptional regulator
LSSPSVYCSVEANKAFNEESQQKRSCQDPRKQAKRVASLLSRIGWLECLVLEYAIRCAERFAPSDVVVYARSKYGLEIDNRRVYDAIQRLLKQGLLAKMERGWYELVDRNLTLKDLEMLCSRAKQRLLARDTKQPGGKESEWGPSERVCDPVIRFHFFPCSGRSLGDLYYCLAVVRYASGRALECVEAEMRGRGYSARAIRSIRRHARELAGRVRGCVIGAHPWRGGKRRELVPLVVFEGVKAHRELGVDLFLGVERASKISGRIYIDRNPYRVREVAL